MLFSVIFWQMTHNPLPDDLPAKNVHVGAAFLVVLGLTAAFYAIDIVVIKELTELEAANQVATAASRHLSIARAVLENLIAGAWAALLLALAFRWIVSFIDPRDRVIEIGPNSIGPRLQSNAQDTSRYVFMGNTASYVTASILPIIVAAARRTGAPRIVDIFIIDPTDQASLTSYAAFKYQVALARANVADGTIARWVNPVFVPNLETNDNVAGKLLAAIYLAAYASLQPAVEVRIHLRKSFTPFRADMTDKEVVLTQESAIEPGVAFSSRGVFYGWYHKEAAAQRTQVRTIDLSGSTNLLRSLNLVHPSSSIAAIEASVLLLAKSLLEISALSLTPAIIAAAARRVANPQHAY